MDQIDHLKQILLPVLGAYLIKRAAIFGSFSKGTEREDSDIDLLIEPSKDFTIFKMLSLEQEISDLTKRKVDLIEFSALKASIKSEVLLSAIPIL